MLDDERWKDSYDAWKTRPYDDLDDDLEEREDEDSDEPDKECIGDDCLFCGEHYRYECFTAEVCEDQMAEAGDEYFAAISNARWDLEIRIEQARDMIHRTILEMSQRARESIGLPRYWCVECGYESCRAVDCDGLPF